MIERLEINGFRLLSGFVADLKDLNVVIGANAAGKSTLINVLHFVSSLATLPVEDAVQTQGGFFSIPSAGSQVRALDLKLHLHKPRTWGKFPGVLFPDDKSFTYDLRLQLNADGTVTVAREILAFAKPDRNKKEPLRLIDASPHRSMLFDFKRKELVPFDTVVQPEPSGKPAAETTTPVAPPEELAKGTSPKAVVRLSQMRFFTEYPLPSYIRSMLANIATYPGFTVGRYSSIRMEASDIRPTTTLAQDGRDLGTVLHEIFTRYDYKDAASEFLEFVRAAYPTVLGISAETAYGSPPKVLVRVREAGMNRAMELWDLSDGMLRFLCLAAALLNPVPSAVIAVDEPELGLHPRLLPIVADIIKTASARNQVLITTHSPDLLNRFDLTDVAVMMREGTKAVWARPSGDEHLRQLLEPVGSSSLGDLHRSGELEAGA